MDLGVVARVGDHDEVLAGDVEHPARELGPAGPSGQHDDGRAHTRAEASVSAMDDVRIREVGPRDGFQNEPEIIPPPTRCG